MRAGVLAAAAVSFTCGGGGGNQPVPARTTVKWVFDSYAALGIPDETPVANVRAMFDAARRYAG